MNSHLNRIEIASPEDRVLTHNGLYHKVIHRTEREYDGDILILKNKFGEVTVTPEHMVLAIRLPKGDKFLRTEHRQGLKSAWYHAEDLRKGDIVLYPILKEIKDMESIDFNVMRSEWDFRSKPIHAKIPIGEDFLRLCGYFISEGHPREEPSKTYIEFSLNINERGIEEDIREITKNLFNIEIKSKERPERKTRQVLISSAMLTRFFKKLFGDYGYTRKLPHFMMLLPPSKQRALLYGLWKGDGYINIERKGARAGYSTTSFELAQQIKMLLLRQGIVASMYTDKAYIKNGIRHRQSYRLHVGQRDSLKKLCNFMGLTYNPKSHASRDSWFDNDFVYIPIMNIQRIEYSGKVYNLEVNKDHSFTTEAFCLHNCGDLMEFYVRVDPETEIIKDIKFKTFGCGSAIATSSMTTELAIGMTLDEAMKLTRSDVATELDGLPPRKMHCSNLAADALHAAIEDYRAKREGRPRPGPKDEDHHDHACEP
ncbi:iron-sulfur cluster assembly scaffold protein [Candidatus Borrarchaeum sp.]|uniref:iron-sulfur cluster assembly scaffold protein n=1 Tax=Candidatus Borrarchaeum sp. TaxID=2846742 RepID=UPI003182FD28